MRLAGLIGDPVEHSLSPVMPNAAFAACGIDARYDLWHSSHVDVPARLESLRAGNVLGANVTVPHKEIVAALLDELSPTARRIGAVNTIINRDGHLSGDNTDAWGFARTIEHALPGDAWTAVVVGAGGAARAVLVALQDAGAARVTLINRTPDRAESLARELSATGSVPIGSAGLDALNDEVTGASILVNATSIGWHGDDLPFPEEVLDGLAPSALVIDLTYRSTSLLRAAQARDLHTADGLPMLVHQGARSFTLWTGIDAPLDVMFAAVATEQARREQG